MNIRSGLLAVFITAFMIMGISRGQSSSGQLCIRAFEDRNANGERDNSEPPIIRGLSATLSNEMNIIIDTLLMERSDRASSGTLCFQQLAAGQYTIRLSSADYIATTPTDYTAQVSDSGVPQSLPYGGQLYIPETPSPTPALTPEQRTQQTLIRSVFAGLGALIIMGAMAVVGALIYMLVMRPAQQRAMRAAYGTGAYPRATGQYPAVPPTDTGNYPTAPPEFEQEQAPPMDEPIAKVRTLDTYRMYSDDDSFEFEGDDTDLPFKLDD